MVNLMETMGIVEKNEEIIKLNNKGITQTFSFSKSFFKNPGFRINSQPIENTAITSNGSDGMLILNVSDNETSNENGSSTANINNKK